MAAAKQQVSFGLDFASLRTVNLAGAIQNGMNNGFQFVVVPLSSGKSKNTQKLKLTGVTEVEDFGDFQFVLGKTADSHDFATAANLEEHETLFNQEVSWANHLGLSFIILPIQAAKTPAVISILMNTVDEYPLMTLVLPFELSRESWKDWNRIHQACSHHKRIQPALVIPEDLPDQWVIDRWYGESVVAFFMDFGLMVLDEKTQVKLPVRHARLFYQLSSTPPSVSVVLTGLEDTTVEPFRMRLACTNIISNSGLCSLQEEWVKEYRDMLQNPLQPLMNNLSFSTYATFEKDSIKYVVYERAILARLKDLKTMKPKGEPFVIVVCGAGRGPLVDRSISASGEAGVKIKIWVVEKNPNAMETLKMRRRNDWKNQDITLVHSDMREFNPEEKADIIVSELLGSFGDNELSPECLDGVEHVLAADGVSIPCEYTSFVAPITSTRLHYKVMQSLKSCETPYVVNLHHYYQIAKARECWSFKHPNRDAQTSALRNARYCSVEFPALAHDVTVHGFAGFFKVFLYKDIFLSIEPTDATKNMFSWFPLFFPLRIPYNFHQGEKITVNMWRKVTKTKVWYEWMISQPRPSELHNPCGRSYWVGL